MKTYSRQTTRYINVMIALTKSPKTTRELAEHLGMKWYQALSDLLQQMRKLHLVRVIKWQKTSNSCGMLAAVWSATPGIDAELPMSPLGWPLTNLRDRNITASPNLLAFAHAWSAMDGGKKSTHELAEISGFALDTIQRMVNSLHEAELIYISKYDRQTSGGEPVRRFSIGYRHPDVERPAPESKWMLNERRRIRVRMERLAA